VADITYIRLEVEFVYLAAILDSYSRRVIGWAPGRSLEDDLAIAALKMAFDGRGQSAGLTHHSESARPHTGAWKIRSAARASSLMSPRRSTPPIPTAWRPPAAPPGNEIFIVRW
jgi:transposase InsO family protein